MKNYNYIPRTAKVVQKKWLSDNTATLSLKLSDKKVFSFHPGQFIMLSVDGFGEVPIGITSSPNRKIIEVGVRSSGMVTEKICSLEIGDEVGINGPLGTGYPLSKIKNRDVVIIAAGIGIFPLRSIIELLGEKKKFVKSLKVLLGAKTPSGLLYQDEYANWEKYAEVKTIVDECDNTWDGCVGNITKLFEEANIKRGSVMIVCGPPVIYKLVADRFAGKSISESDLYFLLERKMECGVGKCQHCTCGKYYTCQDGPVFAYSTIKYNDGIFE